MACPTWSLPDEVLAAFIRGLVVSAVPFRDLKLTSCMSVLEWPIWCDAGGNSWVRHQAAFWSVWGNDLVGKDRASLCSTSLLFLDTASVLVNGQSVMATTLIAPFASVNSIYWADRMYQVVCKCFQTLFYFILTTFQFSNWEIEVLRSQVTSPR